MRQSHTIPTPNHKPTPLLAPKETKGYYNLDEDDDISTQDSTYKCTECASQFYTEPVLKQHLWRVHSEPLLKKSGMQSGLQLQTCSDCTQVFKSQQALKLHMRVKHAKSLSVSNNGADRWTWKICNEGFLSSFALASHSAKSHTRETVS